MKAAAGITFATATWFLVGPVHAGTSEAPVSPAVAESRALYRSVPDATLRLAGGETTTLAALYGETPLLVTLFYRRCPGTCGTLLQSVKIAAEKAGGLGEHYRVLSLSFDERDSVEDLRAQARSLRLEHNPDWLFAVTGQKSVEKLAAALGFWYQMDITSGLFDHAALVAAVDRNGRIVRVLAGAIVSPARMREVVAELRGSFVPLYALPGGTSLSCFRVDPVTLETTLNWGLFLLLVPGVTALLATPLAFAGRKPARRQ